jgi:hypothetical protein
LGLRRVAASKRFGSVSSLHTCRNQNHFLWRICLELFFLTLHGCNSFRLRAMMIFRNPITSLLVRRNREQMSVAMEYVTLSRVTGTRGVAQSFGWDGNHWPSAKRYASLRVQSLFFGHSRIGFVIIFGCSAFLRGVSNAPHMRAFNFAC